MSNFHYYANCIAWQVLILGTAFYCTEHYGVIGLAVAVALVVH